MLITASVVLASLAVPISARVVYEGRAELALAEQAEQEGDFEAQVEHLGRAARWRMPGFGHDEEALDRLLVLGGEQEALGDDGSAMALTAYREARRALLSTRVLGVPHVELFDDVNERIATLMAAQEARFGTDVGGRGDPYAYHLELLQEVPGPSPVPATGAALCFVGWLLATAGFVWRSLDARGRLRAGPAVRWGIGWLVLLVGWMVLLRFAR